MTSLQSPLTNYPNSLCIGTTKVDLISITKDFTYLWYQCPNFLWQPSFRIFQVKSIILVHWPHNDNLPQFKNMVTVVAASKVALSNPAYQWLLPFSDPLSLSTEFLLRNRIQQREKDCHLWAEVTKDHDFHLTCILLGRSHLFTQMKQAARW